MILCGIKGRQKQIAEKRSATKPWLFAWRQGGVPQNTHRDRIRQLLCDNAACKVCDRIAQEAAQFVYSEGADNHDPADLKFPVSTVSCTECPVLPGAFFERGHNSFLQGVSAPAFGSDLGHLAPVKRAASNKSLYFPSFPRGKQEETIHVAKHGAHGWKECSSWAVECDGQKEDIFSLSSTTYSTSFTTWTESSSGLSEDAACHLPKDFRSSSCPTTALKQQKTYRGPSEVDNKAFAEACHHKRVNLTTVLTVQRDVVSRAKVHSALLPAGPSRTQMTNFTLLQVPFVEDAVIASLESHLVVKRVHHLLGLPLALLRSTRTFMPLAPYSASQRHLREVGVVTRPQVLPFVAVGARKKLEVHLKKMVQLRHWQLPWRIQEALSHMKPSSQPGEEESSSAFQKQRSRDTGHVESARKMQKTIAKLTTSAHVLDSKTTSGSQAKLRVHFMKKALEMRLEVFPAIVGHSQKMNKTKARKRPLPKLIPFGQSCPHLRNRLCLSLRGKADAVEMNTKCKYIHFLWGLPTLYTQSLAKIAPSTLTLPTAPSRVHDFIEFGYAEPPFIALSEWKGLESHVLRKRLQHQWGLPGLVQQSLKRFLVSASPSAQLASVPRAGLEVKIFTGFSQKLFFSLEMKQQLETHIRSKIIERRWGLPRRVLESLQVFMPVSPPLIKGLREVPLKAVKRKSSLMTSGSSKKFAGSSEKPCLKRISDCKRQVLKRHMAKKALEIRLSVASSVVQQSQKTAYQAGKCGLSKAVLPWSKPIEPRSRELLFVDEAILHDIQLNVIHKNLTNKWGLPTVYNKSLAQLFQDTVSPAHTAFLSVRSAGFSFAGRETPFIGQRTRELLEWHVKRKTLQHLWGLPSLIQRSLRYFLPAVPHIHLTAGRREVAIFQMELSFLSKATKHGLERNVQKRVLHQRWLLPRRVLESLKLLYPKYGFGSMRSPELWNVGAIRREQACKKDKRVAEAPHQMQLLPTLQAEVQVTLQLHLAKKCLEVHLETPPSVVRLSWRCILLLLKRPLPKMILPGHKPLLSRRSLLPFAGQEQMNRIDVAVRRNQLACLWELGMRYMEALRGMMSGLSSRSTRQRWAVIDFIEVQMPLPPGVDREALELHVKRKRIQHKWGFPVLIHRSLMGFIHGPPSLVFSIKTNICVQVLLSELLFLPQNVFNLLEFHLQKMKLHRLWGLPRRVLESLRLLHPKYKTGTPRQKLSGFSLEPGVGRVSGKAGHETLSVPPVKRRMVATFPHILQGVPMKGSKNLEKIQLHLAKKWLEMQLEAFPTVVACSWRCIVLKSRQPLPKLVLCGCKPLQLRKCFLPFVPKEHADRMEMSVHLCHLLSLWGIGMRYMEALQAMIPPKPFSQPLRCHKVAFSLLQLQTQFVQGQNQDILELHVRKKRLQHKWGFPLLIQKSLRAFMQDFRLGPGFHKTTVHIQILQQKLLFLPWGTCSHFEHHLQRLKLQRQWGLPRRILESLRLLFSDTESTPHEWKEALSARSFSDQPSHGTRPKPRPVGAINTEQHRKKGPRALGAAPQQTQLRLVLRAKAVEKLQLHLTKKALEVHLEVFPAVLRISGKCALFSQSQPLPKPTHPDLRSLKPRSSSFSLGREEMNQIELALQRSHFSSLWGLGTRYVEAVARMVPKLSYPLVRLQEAVFAFSEAETLFFRQRVREALEMHVRKKRMQHEWGFPLLVQRSLRGFIQETPTLSGLSKSVIDSYVLLQELLFLPWDICSQLEYHLQRMKLQRKWGLPGRVLESLKLFLPSRALLPQSHKKFAQAESSTGETQIADRRQVETNNIAPKKAHALEYHLTRKHFEICLEVHPGLLHQSQRRQNGRELKYLPRLIHKGQKQPRSRAFSLLFVLPGTVDILEMNVRHKYLTFLWGLPNKYLEPLSIVDRARCSPVRISQVGFRFRKLQTPFIQKEVREMLEYHIQKKRLHHFWGLPSIIQRSLRAFAPSASTYAHPPHRIGQKIRIQVEHLPFVSEFIQKNLETNLKKMIIHGQWALPKKMHKFLHSLIPNPLAEGKSVDGGTFPYGRDMKEYIVRLPLATYVDGPFKDVSSVVSITFSPIVELFKNSEINILETHLKKKSLEIKFQLMACHKTFAGSIKQILLPKFPLRFSMVKPRRAFLLFVEEEPLAKIQLNISHKYLTYLWGLPSLHTESLHKLSGKVPECLTPRKVATGRGTLKVLMLGREATGEATHHRRSTAALVVSGGAHCRSPKLGPPFLTDEALDLLAFHIKNKKIQHMWGLPSTIQKSLHKFAPFLSERQRSSEQLGIAATHSQGARDVRVATQKLLFFDPSVTELLEEHMKSQIAAHRWRLPRRIQESLKKFLPPESLFQAKGSKDQAQTLPGTCDQIPQAATEQAQRKTNDLPRNIFQQVKRAAKFLTNEASSLLEFHTRQKRIHHEWGLPSTVQRSLRAFVLLPPELPTRSTKATAATFVTSERAAARGKGSINVQIPQSAVHVIIPSQGDLPFLSTDTINCLETHMRSRATKHKWKLPKLIQDLLRALVPLQLEPPEQQKRNFYPGKQIVAMPVGAEVTAFLHPGQEPTFLPREIQNLLEFHIQRKKVQHAWGLPSTVLKSLYVFAPFPLEAEKHTSATEEATIAEELPWARGEVQITTAQSLLFLSSDTKEHLESHVRSITAEHRWGLPKLVQESLKGFLPAVSPSRGTRAQTQPLLHHDSKSLQDSFIQPQFETESSVQQFQDKREASKEFAEKKEPAATSVISARTCFMDCAEQPPSLTAATKRVLELHIQRVLESHIQHKKIQHEWGLPAIIQKSLQAFAPVPQEPHGSLQSAQGVNTDAGKPKNLLAGMRAGAKKRWVLEEVNAAAQKLHFLNPVIKEHLEAHVRTLTTEHRWHLLGLTQKSARSFVPAASPSQTGGVQDQDLLSVSDHDKTLKGTGTHFQTETEKEATSSSKESHRYRSELFYKMGQDGGSVLWQAAEEPPLHPVTDPQHFTGTTGTCGSWKAGRGAPRTGSFQKKSLQRSSLHVRLKKATDGQRLRISVKTQEPEMSPASLFGPLPSKYIGKTSCWSEKLPSSQRATSPSGRVSPIVRGRDPVPRSSKGISWQPECGVQRMAGRSHHPRGKHPRSPGASSAEWELGGSPKKFRYPCNCHLATSRKDSTSSVNSDAEQRWRQQEKEDQGKAKDDESQSFSSSLSGESMKNVPLPEQESAAWASSRPLESGVAQQHNVPISWPATDSSTELSNVAESHSACEDMVAKHYRQAGRGHQGKGSRNLRRRESTPGWRKESRKALPCQVPGYGAAANINAEQQFQVNPTHSLQPQTGTEDGGGAQRPLSTGGVSQFSTESEWEKVGDWDSEEEAVGESIRLGEEEGGSTKAAEGQVGPRCAAEQPQTSLETALVREARAILRDMKLRMAAGQAASEPFGHHIAPQSATDKTDRDTKAQLLPEQQSGAPQSVIFSEEMQASLEEKQAEVLLHGEGGERTAAGEASIVTTGPELSWGRKTSPQEPSVGQEALVEHEVFKMLHAESKGQPVEQGQETQFIGGMCTSEKCSILGRILEKKLYLQHGLHVWMQSSERLGVSQEEKGMERGTGTGHTKSEMENSLGEPPEASHGGRKRKWPMVGLGTGAEGRRPRVHGLRAESGGPLVEDGFLSKEKGDQTDQIRKRDAPNGDQGARDRGQAAAVASRAAVMGEQVAG